MDLRLILAAAVAATAPQLVPASDLEPIRFPSFTSQFTRQEIASQGLEAARERYRLGMGDAAETFLPTAASTGGPTRAEVDAGAREAMRRGTVVQGDFTDPPYVWRPAN